MHHPGIDNSVCDHQVIKIIQETKGHKMTYQCDGVRLAAYTDVDHGGNIDTGKSANGHVISRHNMHQQPAAPTAIGSDESFLIAGDKFIRRSGLVNVFENEYMTWIPYDKRKHGLCQCKCDYNAIL